MNNHGYACRLTIAAPLERTFESIATAESVRGWWTALAEGSEGAGSELRLGFEGLDEQIVMQVDRLERPGRVTWTCLEHTGCEAWRGSEIRFELAGCGDGTELQFRHDGVPAELVEAGWERFLASLAALAETGRGMPFGE
jgi:uncharacterized protein YndB with AHSA1/START domain